MTQQTEPGFRGGHSRSRTAARAAISPIVLVVVGILGPFAAPSIAGAAPLPFEASLTLHHPVTVQVEVLGTDTHVAARSGRHVAEATVPGALDDVGAERLVTSTGPVIVVRGSGGGRSYAWVFVDRAGSPALAWSGRTDLHGDPGERSADALETADRTSDGHPDVVVGQLREGVTTCGGGLVLLNPHGLDDHGALRPVTIGRVSGERVDLSASATSPGPTPPAIGATVRMMGASSALGVEDAASLGAPHALTDGNPATGWVEGRGGPGTGELVVARVDAPRDVRAIAIVRSTAAGVVAPRSVFIVGDAGPALHVTLPEAFDRAWIALPEPRAWSCVALVLDQGPSDAAALHVGLGELEVYTELDYGGGIAGLVETLVAEGSDAERTADWLARAGTDAIDALIQSWERLSALGHRRAVRVAAAHASSEPALRLLSRAAQDDDADVRADALQVLARAGTVGAEALVALAAGGSEDAAATLAESREAFDVAPLLVALEGSGADRPRLRAALGARLARAPSDTADASVERWTPTASTAALASLALGTAESRPELARDLVARAAPSATEFADRYRLALAARHAAHAEATDAWLDAQVAEADTWMVREAALSALALRSPQAIAEGLADASPRVRRTAVTLLAADPASTPRIVDRATSDPWPMVRVAALEALAHRPEEIATLRARVADRSPMVRERAIQLLTERGDRASWPQVAPVLADDQEWPRVTAAALELASTLCIEDAAEGIALVLRRGTRAGAWAPHVDVAVEALRVALRLGGTAAEEARAIAARSTDEAFAPALAGQGALPPCSPSP